MNRAQHAFLGLLAAAAFAACQLGPPHPEQWVSTTASAPSESVLWDIALYALKEQDFPVGAGADPAKLVATTGWKNSLAPFKGEGYRERANLRLEPVEPGKFRIFVQIEKETNEDISRPMELSHAKWEKTEDDLATAQIILAKIEARIGQKLEVAPPKPKRFESTKP